MVRSGLLSQDVVAQRLVEMTGWAVENGALFKQFEFDSFARAFGFMASVAIHAQEMDHHPDWSNAYTTVRISLMSHDAGGITDRDFELAHRIEAVLAG